MEAGAGGAREEVDHARGLPAVLQWVYTGRAEVGLEHHLAGFRLLAKQFKLRTALALLDDDGDGDEDEDEDDDKGGEEDPRSGQRRQGRQGGSDGGSRLTRTEAKGQLILDEGSAPFLAAFGAWADEVLLGNNDEGEGRAISMAAAVAVAVARLPSRSGSSGRTFSSRRTISSAILTTTTPLRRRCRRRRRRWCCTG